jgi:tetratricopeptide (TPR) repeat protein
MDSLVNAAQWVREFLSRVMPAADGLISRVPDMTLLGAATVAVIIGIGAFFGLIGAFVLRDKSTTTAKIDDEIEATLREIRARQAAPTRETEEASAAAPPQTPITPPAPQGQGRRHPMEDVRTVGAHARPASAQTIADTAPLSPIGQPQSPTEPARRDEPALVFRSDAPARRTPPSTPPVSNNAPPLPAFDGQDPIAGLKRDLESGAGAMADIKARMVAALASRSRTTGPTSAEAVAAQDAAATALAAAADPSGRAAASELANGAIEQAFSTLEQDARAATDDAAEKWRRLGALAFGVDATRARIAYEEAYRLDIDDFWTCVFLARLRALNGQMDAAQECALAARDAAGTEDQVSLAHAEMAQIALGAGDARAARDAGGEAVDAARAALQRRPDHPALLRDLAARLVLLGDAEISLGEVAAARSAYSEALALVRKLGHAAPSDPSLARAVADCLEKVAAAQSRLTEHGEAVKTCEESVSIRRRLLAFEPNGSITARGLAGALNTLGEVRRMAGDAAGARAAFDEGLALARRLADAEPGNPALQREVWVAMWRMAQMGGAGIEWAQVAQTMEVIASRGALLQADERFLAEARRRAGLS